MESSSISNKNELIVPSIVREGYGEYIFFSKNDNEIQGPSLGRYQEIYKIFCAASHLKQTANSIPNLTLITKLKETYPELHFTFLPRVLYELIFLRQCIQEDINQGNICIFSQRHIITQENPTEGKTYEIRFPFWKYTEGRRKEIQELRKCWHMCCILDKGEECSDEMMNVAFRLNHLIIEEIIKTSLEGEAFSYATLEKLTQKEISYFENHAEKFPPLVETQKWKNCSGKAGPTLNFGLNCGYSEWFPIYTLSVEKWHEKIILNALALECSKKAKDVFLLYRGANCERDFKNYSDSETHMVSLSFGSGLFAGGMYDGSATPFYYMRQDMTNTRGYVIILPNGDLSDTPFVIPTIHTLTQLFSYGEFFHPRTKAIEEEELDFPRGIKGFLSPVEEMTKELHLFYSKDQDESMKKQFQNYKDKIIYLNIPLTIKIEEEGEDSYIAQKDIDLERIIENYEKSKKI